MGAELLKGDVLVGQIGLAGEGFAHGVSLVSLAVKAEFYLFVINYALLNKLSPASAAKVSNGNVASSLMTRTSPVGS
jgi:hypothetical protein